MRLISVITPCYNEEANVRILCEQVKQVFQELKDYEYEHIFIDNASTDRTVAVLRDIISEDHRVRVIVNARNFGQTRSPYHAITQARGDAVISIVADLQDPPPLIKEFIRKWEEGYKVVLGVKTRSEESPVIYALRTFYYRILRLLSDVELPEHVTGFGLYDRQVVDILRQLNDVNPYLRGLIAEIGFPLATVEYTQPKRKRGLTKNNFFTLFDLAMLGMTSYSRIPLRLATLIGFCSALVSVCVAVFYLVYKLLFWDSFEVGLAPLVTGIFFFVSVQLIFLGIMGEYIGAIYIQVLKRPLVFEKERINFPKSNDGYHSTESGG